jgi:hypothetical protein
VVIDGHLDTLLGQLPRNTSPHAAGTSGNQGMLPMERHTTLLARKSVVRRDSPAPSSEMMSEITSWSSMAIHRQLQLNGLKTIDENQAITRIVRTTYILGVTGNSEVVLDLSGNR